MSNKEILDNLLEEFNTSYKKKLPFYDVKAMYYFHISRFYPERGTISMVTSTHDTKEVDKYLSKENYFVSEITQDIILINNRSEESKSKKIYVSVNYYQNIEHFSVNVHSGGFKRFRRSFKKFLLETQHENIKSLLLKGCKLESTVLPECEITFNNGEKICFSNALDGLRHMKNNNTQITDYNFTHKIYHKNKI